MQCVRVVIVDDQEPFRRAAAAVIDAMDDFVVVGTAGTGEDSVELVRRSCPDLVLMDVSLPGISGLEATQLIRRLDPSPVVLLLSTYDQSEYGDATRTCGAAAYLDKSSFGAELLRRTWRDVGG